MLPGGFVHRKEETKDVVVVRPLIYEMCEGAGNGYKKNAFDDIGFQWIHADSICNRGRKYHMLRYQRNDMKSKTGESCLLQVLPYFNAKVKMAELGIRQGTGQQIVH